MYTCNKKKAPKASFHAFSEFPLLFSYPKFYINYFADFPYNFDM